MAGELRVPAMGESITEAQIGDWLKSEGDHVQVDDELVELETDKATFMIPAPAAGVITKILKRSGETAKVGEVVGYFEEAPAGAPPAKPAGKKENHEAAPTAAPTPDSKAGTASRIMPAAQRALATQGVAAESVAATGPGGRLLKEDVLRHGEQAPAASSKDNQAPVPGWREEQSVPMTPIRKRIAERLVEAQSNAALLTTFNEVDLSAVQELRKNYRDAFLNKYKIKLGFMSFFVKAAIDALKMTPQMNAELRGTNIVYRNYYDIGIAVGGGKGLVVPTLRNAERMSFSEIELAIEDLGRRAKENKIGLAELQGGTFTISNGGIYGSLLSTPIVNPPQSGVLGMHTIQERPVVRDGNIVIRPMMYLALTYDHRVVDGREAVLFLRRIKETLEEPARMLIEV